MWREIIEEIDIDGNGEIDFYEFSKMMQKIVVQVSTPEDGSPIVEN